MTGKWKWVEEKPWWHRHFINFLSGLVGLVFGLSVGSFSHPTPDYILKSEYATATWTFSDSFPPHRLEEAVIEAETFEIFYRVFLFSAWRYDERVHKVMQLELQVALLEVYEENVELLTSYYGAPLNSDSLQILEFQRELYERSR